MAVSDLVMEMRGLAVASASTGGVSEAEREAMQEQADSILKTISFLAGSTTYAGDLVLEGVTPEGLGFVRGPWARPGAEPDRRRT